MRGGRHMLTMQGISARKSAVAPVLAVVLVLLCTLWPAPSRAWPQGGVPQAVWQDSERNNRRSPSQIKRQLRPPQVRAAQLPLADDAQDQRAARPAVSSRPMPRPWRRPRRPETSCPCWNRASGGSRWPRRP